MEFIKSWSLFESESIFIKDKTNMDIIQEIKDLALEYIDNGLTLYYYVYLKYNAITSNLQSGNNILTGYLNHDVDRINWVKLTRFEYEKSISDFQNLSYHFSIDDSRYEIEDSTLEEFEKELLDRIKGLYPNERISSY